MEDNSQNLEKVSRYEKPDLVETPHGIMGLSALVGIGLGIAGFSLSYLVGTSFEYSYKEKDKTHLVDQNIKSHEINLPSQIYKDKLKIEDFSF